MLAAGQNVQLLYVSDLNHQIAAQSVGSRNSLHRLPEFEAATLGGLHPHQLPLRALGLIH